MPSFKTMQKRVGKAQCLVVQELIAQAAHLDGGQLPAWCGLLGSGLRLQGYEFWATGGLGLRSKP